MTAKTVQMDETLQRYLLGASLREAPLLRRLRDETARDPLARMQIAPEQGQFMALLVRLMGAQRAIEVGVFTGYSSICIAAALPADGYLLACDVDEGWTGIAQRYWREAGLAGRIDLRLAPAADTLDAVLAQGAAGSFDFMFIDADKTGYAGYYERGLELLRPGGLLVVDNVLWSGRVADPGDEDEDTRALRAFNARLREDERIWLSMLPLADGLTLALKR